MKMHPERPVSVYLYGGCNDKRISVYKKQLNSKGVFWGVYRNRNHLGHELSRNLSQTIHSNQYLRHKYINIEAIIESRANILLSAMRNNAEQHLIAKRTENELIIYIGRHMFFACDMALDRLFRSRHIDQINDEEYKLTDWGKQQIDDPKKPIMPLI